MSNNTSSAFLGKPPNTSEDYLIVKALLRDVGLKVDPNVGYILVGPRPAGVPYENKQAGIIAGMVLMMLIIIIPTGMRLALRLSRRQMKFGADDWAIILAATSCLLYPIFQIIMVVKGGGGIHTWDVTYEQYVTFLIYGQACRTVYYVAVGMVKVSITLFIRRIADRASRTWKTFCDIFLATCVIYVLVGLFLTPFLCQPIRAFWDPIYRGTLAEPAKCIDKEYVAKILGIIHVVQGGIMLSAPIAILWTIRIDKAKKIRLFINWAVGAIAVLGGLLKLLLFTFNADFMWTYPENILMFTSLDLCLGIVTASVPVLDTLFAGLWSDVTTKISSTAGVTNGPSHYAKGTVRNGMVSGTPQMFSESAENIVKKSPHVELRIMRTDDVHVHYAHSKETDSDGDDVAGEKFGNRRGGSKSQVGTGGHF